ASGALVRLTSCVVVARSALSESYALSLHDALPICERVLQLRRLPSADRGGDRLPRGVAAEHAQRALPEVGQVAMEQDEAPVAGAVETGHRMPCVPRRPPVDAQVALAAERGRCRPRVDRDPLAPAGAQAPELGGCESRGGDT